MNIRFYICVLFIALNSYVLLFAGGSGYVGPDDFDTALEKVRGGEVVKELNISGGNWMDNCTSPEKYQDLVYFRDLEDLSIARCGIKVIPPEVFELKNLKYLDLSSNELKEIPESIGQLMNLEELNLQSNKLSTLPSSIVNLINVYIKIEDNPISEKSGFSSLNLTPPHTQKVIDYYNTKVKPYINGFQGLPEAYTVKASSGLSVRNKPKLKAKKIGAIPYRFKIAVYGESAKTETIDGITAP